MKILLSIIIPVYNVENYLDRCLESIIHYQGEEVEIILINDGSTDNSGERCINWIKRYPSIVYIQKENEGLGSTRNLGIKIAKGEYVTFIDSDDWYEEDAIPEMLLAITRTNAELIYFDFYKVLENNKKEYYQNPVISNISNIWENPILISNMYVAMWNKIYKRDLFIKNNIIIPDIRGEDLAVFPKLLFSTKKIYGLNKGLYCYSYYREDSITATAEKVIEGIDSLKMFWEFFLEHNEYFEIFREEIKRVFFNIINAILEKAKKSLEDINYKKAKNVYMTYFYSCFPEMKSKKNILEATLLLWGSYSSRLVASKLTLGTSGTIKRYGYSSIISITSNFYTWHKLKVFNNNSYRQEMVISDINKSFMKLSENELKKYNYIIIDFLEEVCPIYKVNEDYLTMSEAYQESTIENIIKGDIINFLDQERTDLWKKSCIIFMEKLKNKFLFSNIILLEIYYMEKYNINGVLYEYSNISQIRKINDILKVYYDYFKEKFPEIKYVNIKETEYLYTDAKFLYGCEPYYMNEFYYQRLAELVWKNYF